MHKAVTQFIETCPDRACAKLPQPRLGPVPESGWTPEQAELFKFLRELDEHGTKPFGMLGTVAHHPGLFDCFLALSTQLGANTLVSAREREILALRTAWRAASVYEWAHHFDYGLDAGLDEAEMNRLLQEGISNEWSERERLLISTVDQMLANNSLPSQTVASLMAQYAPAEVVEILFIINQYQGLSKVANSLGIALEPGYAGQSTAEP